MAQPQPVDWFTLRSLSGEVQLTQRRKGLKTLIAFGATAPQWTRASSWDFEITHKEVPQSVGLLWTSDRPVAETSTWQHTTFTTDIHAPGGIRTHNLSRRAALDRATTGTGKTLIVQTCIVSDYRRRGVKSHKEVPQSVGLLWTSDQLVAETSTWQHTTFTIDIHAPGGIRTHNLNRRAALDRAATGTGKRLIVQTCIVSVYRRRGIK